jgi:hypothetical protein
VRILIGSFFIFIGALEASKPVPMNCIFYLNQLESLELFVRKEAAPDELVNTFSLPKVPPRHKMLFLEDYAKEFSPDGHEINLLGQGFSAWVYRVVNTKTGESRVVKLYRSEESDIELLNDLKKIAILGQFSEENKLYKVTKVYSFDEEMVIFEDHQGTSLDNYLYNPHIPQEWKDKALVKYREILDNVQNKIKTWAKESGYEYKPDVIKKKSNGPPDYFAFTLMKGEEILPFWIKQNNVLVTVDGELVVIDPF